MPAYSARLRSNCVLQSCDSWSVFTTEMRACSTRSSKCKSVIFRAKTQGCHHITGSSRVGNKELAAYVSASLDLVEAELASASGWLRLLSFAVPWPPFEFSRWSAQMWSSRDAIWHTAS